MGLIIKGPPSQGFSHHFPYDVFGMFLCKITTKLVADHSSFPIYLEPCGTFGSQLPIYQVEIDPWFQIYRELEDDGGC